MPITSQQVLSDETQADGRRWVIYQYTFDTAEVILHGPRLVPAGLDADAELLALIPRVEQDVESAEDSGYLGQVESGDIADPTTITPAHPSTDTAGDRQKRFRRKLLRYAFQLDNPKRVKAMLLVVYQWVKAQGWTVTQVANYLGISEAKVAAMNQRMQAIEDNAAFLDADLPGDLD